MATVLNRFSYQSPFVRGSSRGDTVAIVVTVVSILQAMEKEDFSGLLMFPIKSIMRDYRVNSKEEKHSTMNRNVSTIRQRSNSVCWITVTFFYHLSMENWISNLRTFTWYLFLCLKLNIFLRRYWITISNLRAATSCHITYNSALQIVNFNWKIVALSLVWVYWYQIAHPPPAHI